MIRLKLSAFFDSIHFLSRKTCAITLMTSNGRTNLTYRTCWSYAEDHPIPWPTYGLHRPMILCERHGFTLHSFFALPLPLFSSFSRHVNMSGLPIFFLFMRSLKCVLEFNNPLKGCITKQKSNVASEESKRESGHSLLHGCMCNR